MEIECRKCKRVMFFGEFIVVAELYFFKMIVKEAVPFVMNALKDKFLSQEKGFFDNQMAGFANNLSIPCPNCKKFECWDAVVVQAPIEVKQENKTTVSL